MKEQRWIFIILLFLTAFIISGTAAYFSVFGLSKLFAGAGLSALILFGTLELGKILGVSVLYRYWRYFSKIIRLLFTTVIVSIMLITSLGIYGFLRNSYDTTSNKLNTVHKEVKIQNKRKQVIQLEINRYQSEINSKNRQIDTYIKNRTTQEELVSNLYNTISDSTLSKNQKWVARKRADEIRNDIKDIEKETTELRNQNTILYNKINSLNDSISIMDRKIIDLESSDVAVEIGPLKYLSDLTNHSMDNIVGILIFLIIIVFDPFAMLLYIIANRLSMVKEENKKKNIKKENNINNLVDDNISSKSNDGDNDKNKEIDETINTIKQKTDMSEKELTTIKDDIEKINDRIDKLSKNTNKDLEKFLKDIKLEFGDHINKIKNGKDNKEIVNIINNMKKDFNNRLNNVENELNNSISEVTIPGRNSFRTSIRQPESKVRIRK
jgi:septal ring factor EnvC (AmiA/AmiB activator)